MVNFLLRHDHQELFLFAPVQSEIGKHLLHQHGLSNEDTLVLIQGEQHYTYSAAVFQTIRQLGGPWRGFLIFSLLPRSFTDSLYRAFAKRRYQLFGRSSTCRLPTPEERARFLDTLS